MQIYQEFNETTLYRRYLLFINSGISCFDSSKKLRNEENINPKNDNQNPELIKFFHPRFTPLRLRKKITTPANVDKRIMYRDRSDF